MKISVLGTGNVLRGDDGIGVYVAEYMKKVNIPYEITACEQDIDFCMDIILNSDITVIIDCAIMGCLPGTACVVDIDEVLGKPAGFLQSHNSLCNYPGLRQAIEARNIKGIFFGIEPENLGFTDKISTSLKCRIGLYADIIEYEIKKLI